MENQVLEQQLKGIDFAWLELTQKCNLKCIHCYNESSPHKSLEGEMKLEDWKRVIDELIEAGCKQIQFIGGEATIHPHISTLIEYAHSKGFEFIELFTNATVINDDLLNLLVEKKVYIATSFYSHDAEAHDAITSRKGSFEKTTKGIEKLSNAGLEIRVGVIEMEQNLNHFEQTQAYLESFGINKESIGYDRLREVGRGNANLSEKENFDQLCGACWQGKLCITPTGAVYPCTFSRKTNVGSVKEKSIDEVLNSLLLKQFRYRLFKKYKGDLVNCSPRCNPNSHPLTCYPDNICWPKGNFPCSPEQTCEPKKCTPDRCYPVKTCNPNETCRPTCKPSARCEPTGICTPTMC